MDHSEQAWPHQRTPLIGRYVSVAGLSCHVLTRGEGRPILLLHGNGSLGEEILGAFPDVPGVSWIAPDRPGFGHSASLPEGSQDPLSQAIWLETLATVLGVGPFTLVAHSLSAALALSFATACPAMVNQLVLLAPFCRPTQERPMLFLRLSAIPYLGHFVRTVPLPPLVRMLRRRIICGYVAPNFPPPWLQSFPISHAANPRAIRSTADELLSFNDGMERIEDGVRPIMPVTAVFGLKDRTAKPFWHLPWLLQRIPQLKAVFLCGCGHAVHHAAPSIILKVVLQQDEFQPGQGSQENRYNRFTFVIGGEAD